MTDPFVERLYAGIPEALEQLRPHVAELEAFTRRVRAAAAVATAERWKVQLPAGTLKGITEEDARRLGAEHHGVVWRSTVTLYADGSELLGAWERVSDGA